MKDEILQKSLEYFLKHGIREMSNQKLVELLGISTKTIYKYFKNKEGLLEEVLYLHYAQQQEMIKNLSIEKSAVCHFFDLWQTAVLGTYNVNNAFYADLHYYDPDLGRKVEAAVTKSLQKNFYASLRRASKKEVFERMSFRKLFWKTFTFSMKPQLGQIASNSSVYPLTLFCLTLLLLLSEVFAPRKKWRY